ncbi:MAG: Uma2 family endonuclease [Spirulinaceae cyanobacterium SM2_1_0]|nr:Uma2 family endonuclease [Spirulinaceae cyanobacterium SM2_1_0]
MTATLVFPQPPQSLDDWLQNPLEQTEWLDGNLVEKNGMTLKHGKVQARLAARWEAYATTSEPGGEIYTDAPCRTQQQGRRPDVAYLPPELVTEYGDVAVLPQSFPLSAEIVSPTDRAEEVIARAVEYLQSGGLEVWLVFPESRWLIVVTATYRQIFIAGETVSTQTTLLGFSIGVDELLA